MAFDDKTRRTLFKTVTACRNLLTEDFDEQLRGRYGIYADEGRVLEIDRLTSLTDTERETARILRERIDHLAAGKGKQGIGEAVHRIRREQAFTVLNRFAALRMAEERGVIRPSVAGGFNSTGFQIFERAAGGEQSAAVAFGSQYDRYLVYLDCLFDELSLDLGVLFDRTDAMGLLFPSENGLRDLFAELNSQSVAHLWSEDETIGWIYQYYNDPEERKKMRAESAAPRNSRELAVRNQFFTPRYVVEFLTDNTLGRIWYEMTEGRTRLAEQCRYLVRRPTEILLKPVDEFLFDGCRDWVREVRAGNFAAAVEDATWDEISSVALAIDGYVAAEKLGIPDVNNHVRPRWDVAENEGMVDDAPLLDQWLLLFCVQRGILREEYQEGNEKLQVAVRAVWNAWVRAAKGENTSEALETLSQEELLRQPVMIPPRPLKDPREIRLLDPACGSMHFGLYAFDLFETIYEEAWDSGSYRELREAYASKDEFLKDVPRLIIEHNIHGIDIDPRATQIAALSLWLRAQKAWQQQKVPAHDRPRVRRSNIVCAEPMPGSPEMLEEFVATLNPPLLGELVKNVFDKMQLAGEAGSLLKIEEEIRTAIDTARKEWLKQQSDLLNRKGGSQVEFFDTAEEQVIDALCSYAEQADTDSYQRRLFADDAARGFAFIDLCRKRYDAVLMNPPFGGFPQQWIEQSRKGYPNSANDIFAAFVERGLAVLENRGSLGAITSRAGFFLTSFQKWRENVLLAKAPPKLLADLGHGVMDAALVEAAAYCLENGNHNGNQSSSVFLRVLEELDDKNSALLAAIDYPETWEGTRYFLTPPNGFSAIQGSPFAYWISEKLRRLFKDLEPVEGGGRTVKVGDHPGDGFRFIRLWWEVPIPNICDSWFSYQKGGAFSPYYPDIHLVANWDLERQSYKGFLGRPGRSSERPSNYDFFFRPGLTWSRRTKSEISLRVLPSKCIFSDKGPAAFVDKDDHDSLLSLLAITNSGIFRSLLATQLAAADAKKGGAARSYEVGLIQRTPLPVIEGQIRLNLVRLALKAWKAMRRSSSGKLTGHTYTHSYLANSTLTLADGINAYYATLAESNEAFSVVQREIDEITYALYGVAEPDRFTISDALSVNDATEDIDDDEEDVEVINVNGSSLVSDLLDYSFGSVIGRWDIRYATGERQPPELPDPFDPLPVCPPGMLQNAEGLPAEPKDLPADYPLRVSWPGILVDDENHPEDIVARVREAIEVIWKNRAETIEAEACEILEVKAKPKEGLDALRVYFRDPNRFFKDHLARYSKSRRKAPIYWPISTDSGSYTLWIYYHRLSRQTLFTCIEMIDLKREDLGRDTEVLRSRVGTDGNAEERQKIEDQAAFLAELKTLRDRLLEVANLPYHPNLNDGVQITAAPLWQCFRHGPWQKVLKETWTDLAKKEKYDWAHLAMSIWPDRVVAKCAKDRSLAIAHGIEDLLWVPDLSSKKKDQCRPLKSPDEELKHLKQAGHSMEDLEKAAQEVTAAEISGLRTHLWIEQPTGTWRRRNSPKEEIENEIARRKGR